MPRPPKPTVTARRMLAWSYSRFNDYRQCPYKACCKHVLKMKEPGSPALDRGSAIHKLAEQFAKAKKTAKCPEELYCFEEEFRELQKINVVVEEQWAFTSTWDETGWFDADAWCRVVVDCAFVSKKRNYLVIIDHKTGKLNEAHLGQLSLYALAGMLKYPTVDGVDVRLWYLDHGIEMPEEETVYTRVDIPRLKKEWEKNVKAMMADTVFKAKPNSNCKYCHFSKAKGGPCKF